MSTGSPAFHSLRSRNHAFDRRIFFPPSLWTCSQARKCIKRRDASGMLRPGHLNLQLTGKQSQTVMCFFTSSLRYLTFWNKPRTEWSLAIPCVVIRCRPLITKDLTQIRRRRQGRRLLGKVSTFCSSYLHLSRVYLFRTFELSFTWNLLSQESAFHAVAANYFTGHVFLKFEKKNF